MLRALAREKRIFLFFWLCFHLLYTLGLHRRVDTVAGRPAARSLSLAGSPALPGLMRRRRRAGTVEGRVCSI
jgi:hypothetical protein